MHELFSTGSSVAVGVFRCLVVLDRENSADGNPQSLLASILSILLNRSHLARVCREWSGLLSNTLTLSLASLHLSAFGCEGAATEICARYTILRDFCNLETSLYKRTIEDFLALPWRLRVARLDKIFHRSDIFSRETFKEALTRAQNFFRPQTVALMERAIAEFPANTYTPTGWPPVSQRHSDEVYMQYELLNFRWGRQCDVTPDEFVASFKDAEIYPLRNLQPVNGSCWSVKAVIKLSSVLCLLPQIDNEVNGTCMFNFRNHSFEATMHVFLCSSLILTCDFVSIPPSLLDV